MVIFKLKELLEKNNMSRYKLRQYTNFSYSRVNDYYFGRVKDIKASEINTLCKLFKCNIQDIIEYKKD
ncbi:MAG: helix-turn-helix transcriptional regulator [Clostridiales bacterium]|nr:helix-turn-helix transcriptional regulator [Clostridiales bacterium]